MHVSWKIKAYAQRACAALPVGPALYYQLQRHLGSLRSVDVLWKLTHQRDLVRFVAKHGVPIEGARIVEVGTGWTALAPIGLWICGATRTVTYDVNRLLAPRVMSEALRWMTTHEKDLVELWQDLVPAERVKERLAIAARHVDRPEALLREAGVEYVAPADAARTGLPDGSMDVHFSYNVLEHVPPGTLLDIMREARRVLRPGGVSVHYVDPSDHFSHFDRTISRVNFLRFEPHQWRAYGENRFAYHNRLRDAEFRRLFEASGFRIEEARFHVNPDSLTALRNGLQVASAWRGHDPEELCREDLVYALRSEQA